MPQDRDCTPVEVWRGGGGDQGGGGSALLSARGIFPWRFFLGESILCLWVNEVKYFTSFWVCFFGRVFFHGDSFDRSI